MTASTPVVATTGHVGLNVTDLTARWGSTSRFSGWTCWVRDKTRTAAGRFWAGTGSLC